MAKFKSSAKPSSTPASQGGTRKKTATKGPAKKLDIEALGGGAHTIMDSAQQIWEAGLNALGRAQQEGTRMFETLVREGAGVEKKTRSMAANKVNSMRDSVRGSVETRVDQVKDRAADTWDRLEKLFEERVQRALTRLGVPGRDELQSLIDRVDTLNASLRSLGNSAKEAAPKSEPKTALAPKKPAAPKKPKPSAAKPTVTPKPAPAKAAAKARKPKAPPAAASHGSEAAPAE